MAQPKQGTFTLENFLLPNFGRFQTSHLATYFNKCYVGAVFF